MIKESEEYNKQKLENIKGNSKMDNDQEMVNFSGAMESIIQGNGKMVRRVEVGIGDLPREKVIWASGLMDKSLEVVSI